MRSYVRILYRRILCEGSAFFDDRTRTFIFNRTRKTFREYKDCTDEARIKKKLREARKFLHRIERANQGQTKSCLKLLQAAYGQRGKTRHRLLEPYTILPADYEHPKPLIPHIPRTAPPPRLCGPLNRLIVSVLHKKVDPMLPSPEYKPLHPTRKANLLWRWRTNLLDRILLPLPFEIVCELERRAGASESHPRYAGNLRIGGPLWNDLYSGQEAHPDLMHLCPSATLIPKTKVTRTHQALPTSSCAAEPSPYSTLSMIQLVNPNFKPMEEVKEGREKKLREARRLYRRILDKVPLLSPLPTASNMWDPKVTFKNSISCWVPGSIVRVQGDKKEEKGDVS
ncbi:hypothetical protein BDA99DRAFT_435620 [Phascolomyces articulosus]|uniref:LYR motif-containing protein Cup1-like N-terminal domain-containing protein n=1 Tax=Phascolomyces articulosus TaxID=60185 RepID=A0AAD5KDX4_9FUNG|nr:hypothetical protein BDA99DRAFT_435620 [Phascolomyces articulosus]